MVLSKRTAGPTPRPRQERGEGTGPDHPEGRSAVARSIRRHPEALREAFQAPSKEGGRAHRETRPRRGSAERRVAQVGRTEPRETVGGCAQEKALTVRYECPQLSPLIVTSDLETNKIETRSDRGPILFFHANVRLRSSGAGTASGP